jgi:hypothetical protein
MNLDIAQDKAARYTTIELTAENAGYLRIITAAHYGSAETLDLCAEFVAHYEKKAVHVALKCTGPANPGQYVLMAGAIALLAAKKNDPIKKPEPASGGHDWLDEELSEHTEEVCGMASHVWDAFRD